LEDIVATGDGDIQQPGDVRQGQRAFLLREQLKEV
jgi:hypothetical protein